MADAPRYEPAQLGNFSDGVFATIVTVMVLLLEPPEDMSKAELLKQLPIFASYIFSFIYIAIYWHDYHRLLLTAEKVGGRMVMANMNLLFWLSIIPFVTRWIGESFHEKLPVVLYAGVLMISVCSYYGLRHAIKTIHKDHSTLPVPEFRRAVISLSGYGLVFLIGAFVSLWVPLIILLCVAASWVTPDKYLYRPRR